MTEKLRYKVATSELEAQGIFDETTALGTNQKGKLVQSTGDFIGLGWEEEEDILITSGNFPNDGSFSGAWGTYTQANIAVVSGNGCGKDGNNYAYVIKRAPDIPSTTTWGGVRVYPPDNLQRITDNKFRFSFDYRGYSGGYNMDVYSAREVGWTTLGVNLTSGWDGPDTGSFDTDWEWVHYQREFTVTSALNNYVAGAYDWNSTTQYPASGDYGIRYNGDLYRKRDARPAPTLGVDPLTEYTNNPSTGAYDVRYVGGAAAGFFNLFDQIKIGFTYQAQNERGTHVHVDNITLTDITNSVTWKYDLSDETWRSENITEDGLDILAKGTAYVGLPRSVTTTLDRFAVEGNREFSINGTSTTPATGRGLTLITFNSSGTVLSNTKYDVHGTAADITALASALSGISATTLWCLTSFDAIGSEATHNGTPALRNQLISMGSRMWNPSEALYLWANDGAQVRNPYAAVGKGQELIKEDGSNATDQTFKRKGVIQTRIS